MSAAYEQLAKISSGFGNERSAALDNWAGSPYEWLLAIPSRAKGAYGEKFVSELFRVNDFDVFKPLSGTDHDRVIQGHRIEIKLSTLWSKAPVYKFQQIRDQDYDYVLCLGISPDSANCWVIPKAEMNVDKEGVSHQHGGARGVDTMWLSFEASSPPAWMNKYGGDLDAAIEMMRSLGTGVHSGKKISKSEMILG
jgi:hypothetical protein